MIRNSKAIEALIGSGDCKDLKPSMPDTFYQTTKHNSEILHHLRANLERNNLHKLKVDVPKTKLTNSLGKGHKYFPSKIPRLKMVKQRRSNSRLLLKSRVSRLRNQNSITKVKESIPELPGKDIKNSISQNVKVAKTSLDPTNHHQRKDEKNFSSNSNNAIKPEISRTPVLPAKKVYKRIQNYPFTHDMFEKNREIGESAGRNKSLQKINSFSRSVASKEKSEVSRFVTSKELRSKVDNNSLKREDVLRSDNTEKAIKPGTIKDFKKSTETTKCSLLKNLSVNSSSKSATKDDKDDILYCAVSSLVDLPQYFNVDNIGKISPINFERARVRFSDPKCLYDRYSVKADGRMTICAGHMTDLLDLDRLKTKRDFKPSTSKATHPKVASQKKYCLTRLYTPISMQHKTLDEKIQKHKAKLSNSKIANKKKMEAGDHEQDRGELKNEKINKSPSPINKRIGDNKVCASRKYNRSNSPKVKNLKPDDKDKSITHDDSVLHSLVDDMSLTKSNKSQNSDSISTQEPINIELLIKEISLLKSKGLLGNDSSSSWSDSSPCEAIQDQKVDVKSCIKHRNKNLNAKKDSSEEFKLKSDKKERQIKKVVEKFVTEILSSTSCSGNDIREDTSDESVLKECKPFIFEPSKFTDTGELLASTGIPLQNRLGHLLNSNLSSKCVEIPPCRSAKDFLQLPPNSHTLTSFDRSIIANNDFSNKSCNNNLGTMPSESWDEYLNVVEHLENMKQRRKTSGEILKIVWKNLNGDAFCRSDEFISLNLQRPLTH